MAKQQKLPTGITLRSDGRYMWRFKHTPKGSGKTDVYSGYCKKLIDAKRALADKKYEVEHEVYSKEKKTILDAWFDEWLKVYKSGICKESTLNYYRNVYKRYIKPVFGRVMIKDLQPGMIQRFINEMAASYSRTTASTVNFLLYDSLQQAAVLKMINQNPMQYTTRPRFKESEKKMALTKTEQDEFLKAAEDSCYYPLYRMATLTGMRIGEILGLSWKDVDFDTGAISIRNTLCYISGKGLYLDTPKSEKSKRIIPMEKNGQLYQLLKDWRKRQLHMKLVAGQYWEPLEGMEDLVFTSKSGTPHYDMNIRTDQKRILKKMKENGIDLGRCTFHTLRHCFATRCVENGIDPKALQAILGHSTFAMTMDLYCDVMEDTKRKELQRIMQAL